MRAARTLYGLAWWLATPVVIAYLLWRSRRQPEYRRHWAERWGWHRARGDTAPLVWIHAVSVGETRAAAPLVARLTERDPRLRILLTHMTPTGRETGRELFGDRVEQAYLPYDTGFATRRFLRAWRPALGVLMETELWPNLAHEARRQGVPLALVSARLSERSLARGRRWGALVRPALAALAYVAAQTEDDAARIRMLGRTQVDVLGNLKFDVGLDETGLARGRAWWARIGERPVVLAASTRDGEEALIAEAWRTEKLLTEDRHSAQGPQPAANDAPQRPLLVVVPRHPQRFDAVERLLAALGLETARRSRALQGEAQLPAGVDVLLGDSMGEMAAYYALADVAIIGGSLLEYGGQNLLEACAAGCPVIVGPHTFNFAQAAQDAIAAGAGLRATDAHRAVALALELLADQPRAAEMRASARRFTDAHRGAAARIAQALRARLPGGSTG
ncbi:MAG: lipid IV(A) 3-deoxy-D-manno-octulosonic acid transferase [Burkholderiales bacterium]|nr:MAG: lipid IV(A) 3-deoxy-D-manno-octulosonic acid transferase [Burkholderiales bacterium]